MKKAFKVFAFVMTLATLTLLCPTLFAQDSTGTGVGGTTTLPSWVPLVASILLGVYELLARLIPTVKNISILGFVIKVIQAIIPNKNAAVPTDPHA
jgi:hypothetical protein